MAGNSTAAVLAAEMMRRWADELAGARLGILIAQLIVTGEQACDPKRGREVDDTSSEWDSGKGGTGGGDAGGETDRCCDDCVDGAGDGTHGSGAASGTLDDIAVHNGNHACDGGTEDEDDGLSGNADPDAALLSHVRVLRRSTDGLLLAGVVRAGWAALRLLHNLQRDMAVALGRCRRRQLPLCPPIGTTLAPASVQQRSLSGSDIVDDANPMDESAAVTTRLNEQQQQRHHKPSQATTTFDSFGCPLTGVMPPDLAMAFATEPADCLRLLLRDGSGEVTLAAEVDSLVAWLIVSTAAYELVANVLGALPWFLVLQFISEGCGDGEYDTAIRMPVQHPPDTGNPSPTPLPSSLLNTCLYDLPTLFATLGAVGPFARPHLGRPAGGALARAAAALVDAQRLLQSVAFARAAEAACCLHRLRVHAPDRPGSSEVEGSTITVNVAVTCPVATVAGTTAMPAQPVNSLSVADFFAKALLRWANFGSAHAVLPTQRLQPSALRADSNTGSNDSECDGDTPALFVRLLGSAQNERTAALAALLVEARRVLVTVAGGGLVSGGRRRQETPPFFEHHPLFADFVAVASPASLKAASGPSSYHVVELADNLHAAAMATYLGARVAATTAAAAGVELLESPPRTYLRLASAARDLLRCAASVLGRGAHDDRRSDRQGFPIPQTTEAKTDRGVRVAAEAALAVVQMTEGWWRPVCDLVWQNAALAARVGVVLRRTQQFWLERWVLLTERARSAAAAAAAAAATLKADSDQLACYVDSYCDDGTSGKLSGEDLVRCAEVVASHVFTEWLRACPVPAGCRLAPTTPNGDRSGSCAGTAPLLLLPPLPGVAAVARWAAVEAFLLALPPGEGTVECSRSSELNEATEVDGSAALCDSWEAHFSLLWHALSLCAPAAASPPHVLGSPSASKAATAAGEREMFDGILSALRAMHPALRPRAVDSLASWGDDAASLNLGALPTPSALPLAEGIPVPVSAVPAGGLSISLRLPTAESAHARRARLYAIASATTLPRLLTAFVDAQRVRLSAQAPVPGEGDSSEVPPLAERPDLVDPALDGLRRRLVATVFLTPEDLPLPPPPPPQYPSQTPIGLAEVAAALDDPFQVARDLARDVVTYLPGPGTYPQSAAAGGADDRTLKPLLLSAREPAFVQLRAVEALLECPEASSSGQAVPAGAEVDSPRCPVIPVDFADSAFDVDETAEGSWPDSADSTNISECSLSVPSIACLTWLRSAPDSLARIAALLDRARGRLEAILYGTLLEAPPALGSELALDQVSRATAPPCSGMRFQQAWNAAAGLTGSVGEFGSGSVASNAEQSGANNANELVQCKPPPPPPPRECASLCDWLVATKASACLLRAGAALAMAVRRLGLACTTAPTTVAQNNTGVGSGSGGSASYDGGSAARSGSSGHPTNPSAPSPAFRSSRISLSPLPASAWDWSFAQRHDLLRFAVAWSRPGVAAQRPAQEERLPLSTMQMAGRARGGGDGWIGRPSGPCVAERPFGDLASEVCWDFSCSFSWMLSHRLTRVCAVHRYPLASPGPFTGLPLPHMLLSTPQTLLSPMPWPSSLLPCVTSVPRPSS